jgi:hypothetical protein
MNSDYVDYDLSAFGESLTQGSCGGNAGPELTFVYDVTSPLTRLSFDTAFPETVNPVVLYVRDSCEGTAEMTGEDFACNRGSSEVPGTSVDLLDVEPGRYYVFVDTSSAMIGPGPFRFRVTTEGAPQCRDEMDNDGDGLVDLADPGCAQPDDLDETDPDPLPACGDGIDNDGDLLIDYPEDPECSAAGGTREARLCQNDYDEIIEVTGEGGSFLLPFDEMNTTGFTDGCRASSGPEMVMLLTLTEPSNVEVNFEDPTASFSAYIRSSCDDGTAQISCNETLSRPLRALNLEPGEYFLFLDSHTADMAVAPSDFPLVDISITSLVTECNDGIDNDGDNLIDLDDVGCARGSDQSEADPALVPACSDGQDNDGDELVDYPADEGCEAAGSRYESPGCLNIEASAVIGMEGGIVSINTEGLIDNYDPRCNSTTDAAGEQMVELHLDQPAQVNLTLSNPSFDAVLYVRSDCETEEPNGYCNDSDPEALSFLRLERGRYFIFVDGYSTGSGTAELNVEVTPLPQQACEDEEDNDMDGFIDTADPGCSSFFDNDETDEATTPECADGIDNDADELIDFPNDPGCFAQGSATESPVCNVPTPFNAIGQSGGSVTFTPIDGGNFFGSSCGQGEGLEQVIELTLDELSDVEISVTTGADFTTAADAIISLYTACNNEIPELGCLSASAARLPLTEAGTYYLVVERGTGVELPNEDWQISVDVTSRIGECNDEVDNDADDLIDLNDPGCTQPFDLSEEDPAEVPQCFDGLDNDGDSLIDYL